MNEWKKREEEQHLVVVCFTTVSNCLSYNHTPLPSHSLSPTDSFCLLALKLLVRESDSSACVSVLFLFLFQFLFRFRFVSSVLLPSLFVFNSRKEIAIDKKKCFMVLAVQKFTAFGFAQMLNALQWLQMWLGYCWNVENMLQLLTNKLHGEIFKYYSIMAYRSLHSV